MQALTYGLVAAASNESRDHVCCGWQHFYDYFCNGQPVKLSL